MQFILIIAWINFSVEQRANVFSSLQMSAQRLKKRAVLLYRHFANYFPAFLTPAYFGGFGNGGGPPRADLKLARTESKTCETERFENI
jgi:hypothetical protein